jgi:cytochrome c oxidase subunit II
MKAALNKAFAAGLVISLMASCSPLPKTLRPAGTGATWISELFWLFTIICTIVWLAVVAALALALLRRRGSADDELVRESSVAAVIVTAVAATVVILIILTTISYFTDRNLAGLASDRSLNIEVTARQWWWEAEYVSSDPSRTLTTANEIHIPIGVPVTFKLASSDVIHSLWVPQLSGKQDLVPGRENLLRVFATRPGVYRGQCAEFCGLQHAHMALLVIAESQEKFAAWYEQQLKPAPDPKSEEALAGRDVFLTKPCVMCHTIAGTLAASRAGPDLTHVAGRRTIAAGTLPFTRGSLAAWIADPQSIKPGAKMPLTALSPDELNAVVAYLEGLR